MAYKKFIQVYNTKNVKKYFILLTEKKDIVKAVVSLDIFSALNVNSVLEDIQVRMVAARELYKLYLAGREYDVRNLS